MDVCTQSQWKQKKTKKETLRAHLCRPVILQQRDRTRVVGVVMVFEQKVPIVGFC